MSPLERLAALAPPTGNGSQARTPTGPAPAGNGSHKSRLLVERYLSDHGIEVRPKQQPNGTAYLVPCPFGSHGANGDTAIFQRDDGMVCFECKHNSCQGLKWADYRDKIGKPDPLRHYDPPLTGDHKSKTATDWPAVPVGTIVKAKDRNNYGDVVEDKGAGCDVHFVSEEGNHFTKFFLKSDLCYQDGRPIVQASGSFTMNTIPGPELDKGDYSLQWLVDDLLVAHQPAILAGMMKTLKTTILIALAVALVLGRKFLGVFDVPKPVRVGFVSCESGLAILQETFRRVCVAYGCALADLDGLVVSDSIPRLENPACIFALTEFCTTNKLEVLILDPAYLMMSGLDAGNVFSMGEKLAALNMLAASAGVTIILAHHLRKNRSNDFARFAPPDLEEIAWSGFCEFARQWLLLGRRSEYEDGSGFHDLWLRVGGSAGHNSLWGLDVNEGNRTDPGGRQWDVEVHPGSEIVQASRKGRADAKAEKQQAEDEAGQRVVIDALAKLPRGEGVFAAAKLYKLTGISEKRLGRLLHQLAEQHIVEPCTAPRSPGHAPQEGAYRLTDEWYSN